MARKTVVSAPLTETQIDADTEKVGTDLRKDKKVRIKIPIDARQPKDIVVPVVVNGHVYRINRGEWVEVPAVVAEILEQSNYI